MYNHSGRITIIIMQILSSLLFVVPISTTAANQEPDHSSIGMRPMMVNGEPVSGSDFPWMASLRAVYPDYIFSIFEESQISECTWIPSSSNLEDEEFAGFVSSEEECVHLVRDYCPDADIANVHKTAFHEDENADCWCQYGSDTTPAPDSSYYSCFFDEITAGKDVTYYSRFCGGSLIDNNPIVILTAAHCLEDFTNSPSGGIENYGDTVELYADLGRTRGPHYFNEYDESGDIWHEVYIPNFDSIHIHPMYDSDTFDHDVALIIVDEVESDNFDYDQYVVATIPDHISIASECCEDNEILTAIGYGRNDDGEDPTNTLERIFMEYHPVEECIDLLNDFFAPHYEWDSWQNDHLCAMGNNTDVCSGDSGGPLFRTHDDGTIEIMGVVSYTFGYSENDDFCNTIHPEGTGETVPSFFSSVAHSNAWISETIHSYDESWIIPEMEGSEESPESTESTHSNSSESADEFNESAPLKSGVSTVSILYGAIGAVVFGLVSCLLCSVGFCLMKIYRQSQEAPIVAPNSPMVPMVGMRNPAERVCSWLTTTVCLPQYCSVFIENGFDAMEILRLVTVDDLIRMNITKVGHQRNIMDEVDKLKLASKLMPQNQPPMMPHYVDQANLLQSGVPVNAQHFHRATEQ